MLSKATLRSREMRWVYGLAFVPLEGVGCTTKRMQLKSNLVSDSPGVAAHAAISPSVIPVYLSLSIKRALVFISVRIAIEKPKTLTYFYCVNSEKYYQVWREFQFQLSDKRIQTDWAMRKRRVENLQERDAQVF